MTDQSTSKDSALESTLLDMLDLEQIDRDLFRGSNPYANVRPGIFGGQVAAQSLRAATHSVESERVPHSLHGYFLRAGRSTKPILLHVDRDRDGRSVSSRRVTAVQEGEVIFSMSASFQIPQVGLDWDGRLQLDVPKPEEVDRSIEVGGHPEQLFEIRPVTEPNPDFLTDVYWARSHVKLPDDPHLQACVLTYLSDLGVGEGELAQEIATMAKPSLDHAVWFHRPARMHEWILYAMQPVSAQGGRLLYTGSLYSEKGDLVATVMQECVLRPPSRAHASTAG
jgi:acyl-CoA thioesterase II